MALSVDCPDHGPQEATFVCQHLVRCLTTRKPVGFFFAGRPRGDAWCSQCEEVRIREGGETGDWNDRSEAFAAIQMLCAACYDRIRSLHGF